MERPNHMSPVDYKIARCKRAGFDHYLELTVSDPQRRGWEFVVSLLQSAGLHVESDADWYENPSADWDLIPADDCRS